MKIPKGQRIWETIYDSKGKELWAIASDEARIRYFLYKIEGNKLSKVKTAASPEPFFEIIRGDK